MFLQIKIQRENRCADKHHPEHEQPAVERGELPRFLTQRFVRQHRAELLEDDVQIEQKKDRRQNEDENRAAEKRLFRHPAEPEQKRREAEVDEAEEFRAVEGVAPGTLLFLKAAHLPESKKQKQIHNERRNNSDWCEQFDPRGFRADDERRRQPPKQRGQSAREFAERAEQFGVGRRHRGNDEGRMTNGKTNLTRAHVCR